MNKLTSRRRFLLTSSLVALGVGTAIGLARQTQMVGKQAHKLTTLESVIDTIVPSGVTSQGQQGALDLKIEDTIRKLSEKKPKFHAQIERLIANIEKAALADYARAFNALNIDEREALLSKLLTQHSQRQLRSDLETIRNTVMHHYYISSQGRVTLGYILPSDYPHY